MAKEINTTGDRIRAEMELVTRQSLMPPPRGSMLLLILREGDWSNAQ